MSTLLINVFSLHLAQDINTIFKFGIIKRHDQRAQTQLITKQPYEEERHHMLTHSPPPKKVDCVLK
jgi:hypothetical protein